MSLLKLDLHVHTIYSKDSTISPQDLIRHALKKNLDGLAICDHGTLDAWKLLKRNFNSDDFYLIPGMEIETDRGEILALFIHDEIKTTNNFFFEIVDKIKQDGGLIVIPHPFDFLRANRLKIDQLGDESLLGCIDGIEIMNSRIIFRQCIEKARDFNRKFHFFETGGSDAHTMNEIGNGFTLLKKELISDEEDIKKALFSRQSRSAGVLSSPLVHAKTIINKFLRGLYF